MDNREAFLSYLNSLDSQYYFFIAGNLLGKVPTPFHKPQLSQRILAFMLCDENRNNLFSSLDDMEIRYLTLVHILGSASDKDLFTFFSDDRYPIIVTKMENLCDRLVVVRSQDRYEINPILKDDMVNGVLDLELALGKDCTCPDAAPVVDRNIIFAVKNLYMSGAIPAREANFHHFEKSDRLDTVFPQFEKRRILEVLRDIDRLIEKRISQYLPFSDSDPCEENLIMKGILQMDPASFAIHAIANAMNGRKLSLEAALTCLMRILRLHSLTLRQAVAVLKIGSGCDDAKAAETIEHLMGFNLAIATGDCLYANPGLWEECPARSELRTDSNLTVSYFGVPAASDILYRFANIQICDKVITYQITKESFIRGIESGLSKQEIISYLDDSSHSAVFDQWEKSFQRVQAYSGILLRCQDDQAAQIVRMHPEIKDHIIMDLGNNMLLMNSCTAYIWEPPLAHAMDLQSLQIIEGADSYRKDNVGSEDDPDQDFQAFDLCSLAKPEGRKDNGVWESLAEELREDARQKNCLSTEVEALINARIIYSKSQLDSSFSYSSLVSVSGFDYNAKMTLLRDVIKAKNSIVVLELAEDVLVTKPFEILKGEGRNSFLKVKVLPDSIERSIPVSSIFKISVVRK